MLTSKQREEAFRRDFEYLLEKHKAELNVTDDGKSYGLHSAIAVVSMENEWDDDGYLISEYTEFNL